jgi:hypothetical protein
MMGPSFSFAALLIAHDAVEGDRDALAAMARDALAIGAALVVVALPPEIDAPVGVRVARTKPSGASVTALRLGMAQLTNTTARGVLLLPLRGAHPPIVSLLALVDAAKRAGDAIVAFTHASLDESPVFVPRDAWLELVTLGEGGMDALAVRRIVQRVENSPE